MKFSPTVLILMIGWIGVLAMGVRELGRRRGFSAKSIAYVYGLLAGLLLYAAAIGVLAFDGMFVDESVLRSLPYFYMPAIPVTLVAMSVVMSARLRAAVGGLIRSAPLHWLIGIHALRLAAIGSIFKMFAGELPAHFIVPVGVPDFLIGLGALVLARRMARGATVPTRVVWSWNLLGVLPFVPAPVLLHLSMPGPLNFLHGTPTTVEVFEFPMALVPTVLVPVMLMLHGAIWWRLRSDENGVDLGVRIADVSACATMGK